MKTAPLWQISVATTGEAEDAVATLLENLFHLPPTIYADAERDRSRVTIYGTDRTAWDKHRRAGLKAGLDRIRRCGLRVGRGKVVMKSLRPQAWAESWRRHFRPLAIGRRLLIKPSWSRRRPFPGQAVVVLDPGLCFGTGRHPTTAFCLRRLVAGCKPGLRPSVLDLGTGSGLLAIAAAKFGCSPVRALDNDPLSVRVARQNARKNRVHPRVAFHHADLRHLPLKSRRRFDIVFANLTDDLLVSAVDRIVNRLHPAGKLVLAGVLAGQFPRVRRAYAAAGWRPSASRLEGGWKSAVFQRAESF